MERLISVLKSHPEIGEALAFLIGAGVLTPEEIRAYYNLEPKGENNDDI